MICLVPRSFCPVYTLRTRSRRIVSHRPTGIVDRVAQPGPRLRRLRLLDFAQIELSPEI